jgi:hypothetical protein
MCARSELSKIEELCEYAGALPVKETKIRSNTARKLVTVANIASSPAPTAQPPQTV